MSKQHVLVFDEVRGLDPRTTALWVTPSVRAKVESALSFRVQPSLQLLPKEFTTLVVIGGGTLIDEAKVWRLERAPGLNLIAIPSIWGSGAEASPIAVRNRGGKKDIRFDPKLVPTALAVWPELARSVPPAKARFACGDCWAHVLEGFLSPLAAEPLRCEMASLLTRMLATPITNDPAWFELGAQACAGQARSSVGLVHGMAHTLEGVLRAREPEVDWGHARLCSLFLWPVMRFNMQASSKCRDLLDQHNVSPQAILDEVRILFDLEAYDHVLPVLKENWMSILRDPCSRANSALVRPASMDFFVNKEFQ